MTRSQFAILLTVCAVMSLGGSFGAIYLLQGDAVNAQAAKDPEVLRARKFELVDEKGKVRASLGIDKKDKTDFVLIDGNGKVRIQVAADSRGAAIRLQGADEKPRFMVANFGDDKRDGTLLIITDSRMKPRFSISHKGLADAKLAESEETLLSIADRNAVPRCILGHIGSNDTSIGIYGPKEKPRVFLKANDDDSGSGIFLFDERGGTECRLISGRDGNAGLELKSKLSMIRATASVNGTAGFTLESDGNIRVRGLVSKSGDGLLEILDAKGKQVWSGGKTSKDGE